MSLTCSVSNFRGIKAAMISVSPIALLAGANEQGKSSIVDALRNLLDGQKQPYGLTKDQQPTLLLHHESNGNSCVSIRGDGRWMQIDYPSGDVETEGAPFRATPWATGSARFMDLKPLERTQMLAEYLRARPTEEELVAALEANDAIQSTEESQKEIWTATQNKGWDGAWEQARTDATKAKGAWEQITKARYGIKVGANWRPAGWTTEHEMIKDKDIATELAAAEAALEQAIGKVAINDDERKKLEALQLQIPKLEQALKPRAQEGERAKAAKEAAERQLKQVPIIPPDNWPACPHCQKPVQVLAGKRPGESLLRAAPPSLADDERKKLTEQADNAERLLREANQKYEEATDNWRGARADLDAAEGAKSRLENSDAQAMTGQQLQDLRDEVTRCKSIIGAKEKIRAALLAHTAVTEKLALAEILSPTGLRATKMQGRMAAFNERLAELSGIAGWTAAAIDPESLSLTLAGVPYALCSGSGKMRCDIVLQVALALQDGSEILLIDEADILDGAGRNGLFALLQHAGLYSVVAMMMSGKKAVPNLQAIGIGSTWWVENAEARDIAA